MNVCNISTAKDSLLARHLASGTGRSREPASGLILTLLYFLLIV